MTRNSRTLARSALVSAVLAALAACATTSATNGHKSVVAGTSWLVDHTTTLQSLSIAPGGTLAAPPGELLTLTVDGVDVPLAPGDYHGHVVVTVTEDIPVKFHELPAHHYRAAVYVDHGAYEADKSVAAAVESGHVDAKAASDVRIDSREERFNGILVTGDSTYTITNPHIEMTGNGGNDFAGFGAALMSSGNAQVTVQGAHIVNRGAVRTAVFVGGHSTMTVKDSFIDTYNGVLPPDYKFTIEVGRMMEVPWMLGLSGNVRATNLVDHGTVNYIHTHIRTQGWGALSTDDAAHTRLFAKDSTIETVESGYGSYSIGDSVNTFSHCVFNVADIGLIIAGEGSGIFTDGTVVHSRRYGVMMHSGSGGGTLTIDKDSAIESASTAIEVKGRGTTILVDHARIQPGNGILLQAMVNDDPFAAGPGPMVGVQGGAGGPPGAPPPGPSKSFSPDVLFTVRQATLAGDIINSRTAQGELSVTLEHAQLTGAISTATAAPAGGKAPDRATYQMIGAVTNTLGPSHDKYGAEVALDAASHWFVTKPSYLTKLTVQDGASVSTPDGKAVMLSLDGKPVALKAGTYVGQIVVRPAS